MHSIGLANGQYFALGSSGNKHAVTPYIPSIQLIAVKCICLVYTYVLYCQHIIKHPHLNGFNTHQKLSHVKLVIFP